MIQHKGGFVAIGYHLHYLQMVATVMTPLFTPTMTGLATPDPLAFAFTAKTSAHASRGGAGPLMLDEAGWQAWWQQPSQAEARALYIHVPFAASAAASATSSKMAPIRRA